MNLLPPSSLPCYLSFFLCHSAHSRTHRCKKIYFSYNRYRPLLIGGMFSQTYIDITSMTNNLPLFRFSHIFLCCLSLKCAVMCNWEREDHLHNLIVIVPPMYRLVGNSLPHHSFPCCIRWPFFSLLQRKRH